jgi:hypothetical protein
MKRICPSCGSDDVHSVLSSRSHLGERCRSCGYRAAVFPEMDGASAAQFRKRAGRGQPAPQTPLHVVHRTTSSLALNIFGIALAVFFTLVLLWAIFR